MAVLAAWRTLIVEDVRQRAEQSHVNAHRCSRIAQSTLGLQLADELEEIARSFEQEGHVLANRMQTAAYQLRFKPAMKSGQPVSFWKPVAIEFNLR